MINRDGTPSMDDAALASSREDSTNENDGPAGATAASQQTLEGESHLAELNRRKHLAEALAARSAAEAEALRRQGPGRPEDYRAPEDYTRAVAEQAVRDVGADLLARQAAQAQDFAARAAQDAWAESTAEFRRKVPDFDTVAHNPNLAVTPIMADAIRESSRGAEIAYYLGKNPSEAAKIASLPPLSQATAIARLEGRLSNGQASISRAPQPVGTLSGRGGSGGQALEDMSFEDYRRARGY